jgi:hypothetical protein
MSDDVWRSLTALAARQHGVFTRKQASNLGIDSRRLKTALGNGRVVLLSEQVLALGGSVQSLRRDAQAATLLSPHAAVSHRTASALFGFEGVRSMRTEISLPITTRLKVPTTMNVTVHHTSVLDRRDLVKVAGIPCTSKARTLVDLGNVLAPDAVLVALIGAHREGLSLRMLREAAHRLQRPGQRGASVILGHLNTFEHAGSAPESWFEEVVRRIIDHPDLPPLVSQYELVHRGKFVARFDHAFPSVCVAVEAHSKRFHFGPVREAADDERDLRAQRAGWTIVYLGWHVTKRPSEVVEVLRDVVRARRQLPADATPMGQDTPVPPIPQ